MSHSRYEVRNDRGTRIAFEELYDEHFDGIFRYVLHRVGNVAEAQDLTSQTFFKALRGLWRFRWSGGSFSAWLYRIATNEVHSHFRRRRPVVQVEALENGAGSAVAQETAEAEAAISRHETFRRVSRSLHRLKREEQALVVLRYLEEKPFAEIAAILRKKIGAVTMGTRRALEKLKIDMDRQEVEDERAGKRLAEPAGSAGRSVQADAAP